MDFWASSETYAPAGAAVEKVRILIEPAVQDALTGSPFAAVDLHLRYVPIVMPTELLARYPARSKARRKSRILDCAPQLDYETFVLGSFSDQLRAYVSGIGTSSFLLPEFDFSSADISEFDALLETVAKDFTSGSHSH